MPKVGGSRPGAGRRKGSVSQRHVESVAEAFAAGKSAVEYMLDIMRDDNAEEKRRDWAAEKVAPYLHPRPAPIAQRIEIDLPDISTAEGVTLALAKVAKVVAAGELAPSEGQSLIAIIEAQRKAIDIQEMMERIERLEAAPGGKPMGNIVTLRTRLEALEHKRSTLHHVATKAERDAAFDAYQARLMKLSDAELHREEQSQLASTVASYDPATDAVPLQNQEASVKALFSQVRWERKPTLYDKPVVLKNFGQRKRSSDDGNNPTPPRAA